MSATAASNESVGSSGPDWLSGAIAGIAAAFVVGIVIYFGFNPDIIEESIPHPIGQSGALVGWSILLVIGLVVGLVYGALNAIEQFDTWASTSRTGGLLGLVYGLFLWGLAVLIVPFLMGDGVDGIGEYAVTAEGLLGYVLFGVLIGFLYLLVPVLRS